MGENEVNTVEISVEEYLRLLRLDERVEVIKRIVQETKYISTADLITILDIHIDGGEK